MSNMIHIASGDYPLSVQDVRARHTLTSFLNPFEPPIGYSWVQETTKPSVNPFTQRVEESAPVEVEGVWTQTWMVVSLSVEEQGAAIDQAKATLTEQVTAQRWSVETGGITLPNGVQIATGTADQNRVTTVIANATLAGIDQVEFKAATGWVTLALDQVQGIAAASALHVQACFSAERAHHEAIEALTDPAEIETYTLGAGWPAHNSFN